jgi:hypothetical protein
LTFSFPVFTAQRFAVEFIPAEQNCSPLFFEQF